MRNEFTGLVGCDEGYEYRPQALACAVLGAGGESAVGGAGGARDDLPRAPADVDCRGDSSPCQDFELGYCDGAGGAPSTCESGCITDEDCGPNAVCTCHGATTHGGWCVYDASCRTDDDCQTGYHCVRYFINCGGGFACQTPEDSCDDCANGEACAPSGPDRTGPYECQPSAVCGRPFLVRGAPRLAAVIASDAWCKPILSGANS